MKRLFLACAFVGVAGTMGSAHAVPLTSSMVTIWSADTPGNNAGSPAQQGLPTAVGLFAGPLPLVAGNTAFANTIAYNDPERRHDRRFFCQSRGRGHRTPRNLRCDVPGA